MAKRERIAVGKPNNYFSSQKPHHKFVSTGCTLLNCALGGGWVLGRVANVVGDKSTSKTGLATETLINFCRAYPDGQAAYRDAESAFDMPYAEAMGLPLERVDFGEKQITTVEEFYRDLESFLDKQIKRDAPGVYILDSLDAISDEAEMEREIGDSSYGGNKAKKLSEFFRKLSPKIERSKVLLLIVSQVRDNIGAMFGEKHKRSGGKALDFYASQIVWLAHLGMLDRTMNKIKRAYGIIVKAKVKKNKISMPFREADFEYHFGYGVEDVVSNLNWLEKVGKLELVGDEKCLDDLVSSDDTTYQNEGLRIAEIVRTEWSKIEEDFLPKRTKYGAA